MKAKLETKVCSTCGAEKPVADFYFRNGRPRSRCKLCEQAAQKEFRDTHAEHVKAQKKEYNRIHKDRNDAYNHKYAAEHSAEAVERTKKWYRDNPEKARALSLRTVHRRNARKRALPATFTEDEWQECKQFFGCQCAYCGAEAALTQDHVIPVSKCGGYVRENIIPACGSCNSSKMNHDIWEWYRSKPFYSVEREIRIRIYLFQQANTVRADTDGPCNA